MARRPPPPSPVTTPVTPLLAALAAALVLAGCGSSPSRPPQPGTDGPIRRMEPTPPAAASTTSRSARAPAPAAAEEADGPPSDPPPDLMAVPDALPRLEPVPAGGPNKPYEVAGVRHEPLRGDPAWQQQGLASWYGRKFHGRRTASGERYDMYAMTAAHRTLPIPSYVRVRNPANGREVVVRVNDRGPFHRDRIIDLSYTAALKLGLLRGAGLVEVQRITQQAIRSGNWQGAPADPGVRVLAAREPMAADAAVGRATPDADLLGQWLQRQSATAGRAVGPSVGPSVGPPTGPSAGPTASPSPSPGPSRNPAAGTAPGTAPGGPLQPVP